MSVSVRRSPPVPWPTVSLTGVKSNPRWRVQTLRQICMQNQPGRAIMLMGVFMSCCEGSWCVQRDSCRFL